MNVWLRIQFGVKVQVSLETYLRLSSRSRGTNGYCWLHGEERQDLTLVHDSGCSTEFKIAPIKLQGLGKIRTH